METPKSSNKRVRGSDDDEVPFRCWWLETRARDGVTAALAGVGNRFVGSVAV